MRTLNKLGMAWFPQGCPDPPGPEYEHFCFVGARRIFGGAAPALRSRYYRVGPAGDPGLPPGFPSGLGRCFPRSFVGPCGRFRRTFSMADLALTPASGATPSASALAA